MVLDLFRAIRDFFAGLFGKFSYEHLMILLSGIVIGFLLCLMIYAVFVISSLKDEKKKIIERSRNADEEKIRRLINSAKNQYSEESSSGTTGKKAHEVMDISWNLLNDIAKEYFLESKYPIYELSVEEIIMLIHYITDRINSIFQGPVLKPFKKVRISYILKLVDMKKRMDESKAMKAANKVRTPWSAAVAVFNIFNPVYWVKKLMISTTLVAVTNKIAVTIIEVVGDETNKIYSKSVFSPEESNREIEQSIKEIEKMIEEK